MIRRGIYPGSFNPPTLAHLAVSQAAADQFELDVVVWSISSTTLGKEGVVRPTLEDRLDVVQRVAASSPLIEYQLTDVQLLVDLAHDFDVLIMGADKWHQINEPHWYGGEGQRDAMLARLPQLAIADRQNLSVPANARLDALDKQTLDISSTAARAGETWQMVPEARAFAEATGAWIDPERYERRSSSAR